MLPAEHPGAVGGPSFSCLESSCSNSYGAARSAGSCSATAAVTPGNGERKLLSLLTPALQTQASHGSVHESPYSPRAICKSGDHALGSHAPFPFPLFLPGRNACSFPKSTLGFVEVAKHDALCESTSSCFPTKDGSLHQNALVAISHNYE